MKEIFNVFLSVASFFGVKVRSDFAVAPRDVSAVLVEEEMDSVDSVLKVFSFLEVTDWIGIFRLGGRGSSDGEAHIALFSILLSTGNILTGLLVAPHQRCAGKDCNE